MKVDDILSKVEIFEVGPRDGFQNIASKLSTNFKKEIIDGIYNSGVHNVQITSFVNPKAVPQMADSKEISKYCIENYYDKNNYALVPNYLGGELATESGLKTLSFVVSISTTHNLKNVNKTTEKSFEELRRIREDFPDHYIILDLATTFGCYFEGETSLTDIIKFINTGKEIGVNEINLCDTFGLADPRQVSIVIKEIKKHHNDMIFRVHFHDTRNMGMVNSLEAIKSGITRVETAVGGLGGCPFAPGASGNTSTEDFVYMLHRIGYETNIDFDKLLKVSRKLHESVQGNFSGHNIMIDTSKFNTQ